MLNQYFDRIYVPYIDDNEINHMKWRLEELGVEVEYFRGYNGHKCIKYDNFLKAQIIKKKSDSSIILLTKGQYGHINTFINILKDAKKNNYNRILCLEPDIYFCKDFNDKYNNYKDIDYRILYFGASQNWFYKENTWETIKINNIGYYNAYKTLGTFAIAFNKTIYDEVINEISLFKAPTDVALTKIQEKYNDIFVCYPNIICCNVTNSTTNGIKSNKVIQIDRMKGNKWILEYDTRDKYDIIINDINKVVTIILYVNSVMDNNKIEVNCDNKIINKGGIYEIIIEKPKKIIKMTLNNFFIDKYELLFI